MNEPAEKDLREIVMALSDELAYVPAYEFAARIRRLCRERSLAA